MPVPSLERYLIQSPKGTVLFEEGDRGECMYVLQSGAVQVLRRIGSAKVPLALLGPGECVGEMALLDGQPRSASAVVAEDAQLLQIDAATFEQLIQDHAEIALRIMRKLAQRLREANGRLEAYLARNEIRGAIERLGELAGEGGADGFRGLPAGSCAPWLAPRLGLSLHEAEGVWKQLLGAGVLRERGEQIELAPAPQIDEYLAYLELKQRYDPVGVRELAESIGMPEGEIDRIVRKVLARRLANAEGLADSYQQFLTLKKRFEYLDRP